MSQTLSENVGALPTLFTPSAETYEERLVPAIFGPFAADLVHLVAPRPGERVLDVACGSGIVARTAAAAVGPTGAVVGVDINPAMLDVANRVCARHPASPTWQVADASGPLPFEECAFDVVLCQQGLQFLNDRAAALSELRRVAAPAARLAVSTWRGLDQHPCLQAYDVALRDHLPADVIAGSDAPFSLGTAAELGALVRGAGFANVRLTTSVRPIRFATAEAMLNAIAGAHAPLAAALAGMREAARRALVADLAVRLAPWTDDDGVGYPMVTSVAVVLP